MMPIGKFGVDGCHLDGGRDQCVLEVTKGVNHHLNDNHQPQIALLASSASIELVSASARVTSAKSQPKVSDIERPGPIDRTPETPGSGKNG